MATLENLIKDFDNIPYAIKRELELLTKLSYKTQSKQIQLENMYNRTVENLNNVPETPEETNILNGKIRTIRKNQKEIFFLHSEKIASVEKIQKIVNFFYPKKIKSALCRTECCVVQLKDEFKGNF
ncbi:hypothetical protein MHBO_000533 [Bonamia ostreae]|uniref:Inhibitor of growth protein N-terminal histone-binding domain-containing protein n=1 Tax=Bonamia ostreae TaxID=126728 RepID=A0ABV2AFZ9_9EUKA